MQHKTRIARSSWRRPYLKPTNAPARLGGRGAAKSRVMSLELPSRNGQNQQPSILLRVPRTQNPTLATGLQVVRASPRQV